MSYSKTLRTSPQKIAVLLLMTISNQKRISAIDTRRICAQKELFTYIFNASFRLYEKVIRP